MKTPTKQNVVDMLTELRNVTGQRAYTFGQSLHFAHMQADRFRKWCQANEADVNLIGLIKQREVPVTFVPSYKIGEHSGLTTDQVNGKLEVFINDAEPPVRQRFSLLHEWKHVIDFPNRAVLYSRLGSGDERLKARLIESLANEFAAYVLMPTPLVKRVWFKTQDIGLTATFFNVSREAVTTRLERLRIIGSPRELPRVYFRTASGFPPIELTPALVPID